MHLQRPMHALRWGKGNGRPQIMLRPWSHVEMEPSVHCPEMKSEWTIGSLFLSVTWRCYVRPRVSPSAADVYARGWTVLYPPSMSAAVLHETSMCMRHLVCFFFFFFCGYAIWFAGRRRLLLERNRWLTGPLARILPFAGA